MTLPASSSMGNRRACRRAELHVPVLLDAERSYYTAHCCDVSPAGIGVETQAELPVGTLLEVYFELPTGNAVEARATVARAGTNRLGLRFEELAPEATGALREYSEDWRRQLLQSCATRGVKIVSHPPPPNAVRAPSNRAPFTPTEDKSQVRVRIAPIIAVTAARKA